MSGAARAPARSLKARALQCLAQREHSRAELRRKLLAHASAQDVSAEDELPDGSALAQVDAVLDWLELHHYLSQQRFAESRVRVRAARFGNLRIRQELAQHDVALSLEAERSLAESELERARAVWARKFTAPPSSASERAKQVRFLAGRGFTAEVIRRLLRAARQRRGDAMDGTADPD